MPSVCLQAANELDVSQEVKSGNGSANTNVTWLITSITNLGYPSPTATPNPTVAPSSFVSRVGNNLYFNGTPFRFAGANIHWLGLLQGGINGPVPPSQTRVANVLSNANSMHATVIRSMTLGDTVGCTSCIEPSLNTFNDQAFNIIDYAIKTAASYNMKLIIPLVDDYHYYAGGKHTYTDWENDSNEDDFYSNPTVIQDFKNHIAHILNHVNQYTGIAYKDDPTIMAWETGNELQNASGTWDDNWTQTIAQYIKSIAPNQLVADGHQANSSKDLTSNQLQLSEVDLYTSHFYNNTDAEYSTQAQTSAGLAQQYNKVYYIGEYDWTSTSGTTE